MRGDSGFSRDDVLSWCKSHAVYYCLGLQKNTVLVARLEPALVRARAQHHRLGGTTARRFAGFKYRTRSSWSRTRRVVGKAEVMAQGDNPRFVVTNLPARGWTDQKDRKRFRPAPAV